MMILKKIIQAIRRHKRFLVSTHVNPDPDAIASELAVAMYLKKLGKEVHVINCEKVPKRFLFLPRASQIRSFNECKKIHFDVAVILDCGELDRIGRIRQLLDTKTMIINIDHHITNDSFGNLNLVKRQSSSTAEVLYELFHEAKFPMNKNLAVYLYSGIMTDTGSFRYENTTAKTHQVVADLMKHKFCANDLYRRYYETIPLNDLKLFTKVISRFSSLEDGKVALVSLPDREVKKFSKEFDLRDAIFKLLRAVKEVEVVVILTEVGKRKTRINLRSSGYVDVAQLASMFQGGGHKRASGCLINKTLHGAQLELMQALRKLL